MYLLYLDDSGSAENQSEDVLVLGGVCIFEAQVHFLINQLDKLAETIDPADPFNIEFHASEIFARKKAPWDKMEKDEAKGIIKAVLKTLLGSYETARLFACAIHKESFPGCDLMAMAFEDMCQRFDRFLSTQSAAGDRQRGMIILDNSVHEVALQKKSCEFRRSGTQWGKLYNLADVPFFVDSRASRIVQLADHVSYAVFRRYQSSDTQYFDIIASKFHSVDGVVHGLAHKQKKDPNCRCLACATRHQTQKP